MVNRVTASMPAIIALSIAVLSARQIRDVRHEATGTALLSGTVLSADSTKTPLRRARVTVTSPSLVSPRVTATDDAGRFVMNALPAGQYSLAADKGGYLKMNYGATRPARQGTSVVLAEGRRAGGLVIAMPRGAVMAGTVTNASGEPEPDVQVTALYWQRRNGERTLVPVSQTETDDRGEYRLPGLNAGDYLVSVEPPDSSRGPADLIQISEGAVDRALREIQQPAIAGGAAPAATARSVALGPAPVFYPGTVRSAAATTVTVATGEERAGIDIRTELVPMTRITGTVTADGSPLAGVQVVLSSLGPPAPNFAFAIGARLGPKRTDAQGQFTFVGVPPGEYRVWASTRAIATRSGGSPPDPNPRMAFATLDVSGNGDDRAVDLSLRPGMSMSGRVTFSAQGTPPATPPGSQVILEGTHIDPGLEVDRYTADAAPDATFRVGGLTPGRFLLNATATGSTATSGWALKSIMLAGRDLLDAPFALAPDDILSDVVVTFTDHPSELSGTLQGSSGIPTSDYFIVVYSADRQFWFPNSRRIVSVRPNTSGAYSVRNLPAGEYFISALTDVEDGEWFDPEFLQALTASSPTRIVIKDGEQKRQDLRIGR